MVLKFKHTNKQTTEGAKNKMEKRKQKQKNDNEEKGMKDTSRPNKSHIKSNRKLRKE